MRREWHQACSPAQGTLQPKKGGGPRGPKSVMERAREWANASPDNGLYTAAVAVSNRPQVAQQGRKRQQGKTTGRLMQPSKISEVHPFDETLRAWQQGVPVDCGENWSRQAIEEAVARGPHPSALTPDALQLFQEDIAYQVKAGFTKVVPWDKLKGNLPANLKISPVAVVPQINRRGRIILDLSFPVFRPEQDKRTPRRR